MYKVLTLNLLLCKDFGRSTKKKVTNEHTNIYTSYLLKVVRIITGAREQNIMKVRER